MGGLDGMSLAPRLFDWKRSRHVRQSEDRAPKIVPLNDPSIIHQTTILRSSVSVSGESSALEKAGK